MIKFPLHDFVARKDISFYFDSSGSKTFVWVIIWGSFTTLDYRDGPNPIRIPKCPTITMEWDIYIYKLIFPSAWLTRPIKKASKRLVKMARLFRDLLFFKDHDFRDDTTI